MLVVLQPAGAQAGLTNRNKPPPSLSLYGLGRALAVRTETSVKAMLGVSPFGASPDTPNHTPKNPRLSADNGARERPEGLMIYLILLEFSTPSRAFANRVMVPQAGLEPARLSAIDFESTASTISPLGHSGRRNLEHVPKRGNRLSDRNMLWLFDWSSFCSFRCGHLKGKSSGN